MGNLSQRVNPCIGAACPVHTDRFLSADPGQDRFKLALNRTLTSLELKTGKVGSIVLKSKAYTAH